MRLRSVFTTVALVGFVVGFTLDDAASARRAEAPTPHITSVAPTPLKPSNAPQTLTVTGTGFASGLTLIVTTPGGQTQRFTAGDVKSARETSFQVEMLLGTAGNYSLVVTNPSGDASEPFALTVGSASGAGPRIDRTQPDHATRDPQPQVIKLVGQNFAAGLSVTLTDPIGTATVIGGSAIGDVTPVTATLSLVLDKSGQYSLMITNPSGESSNAVSLDVAVPVSSRRHK